MQTKAHGVPTNKKPRRSPADEVDVTARIHEAAARVGASAVDYLDRNDEELDVLRHLAGVAENIFEHDGRMSNDPTEIVLEALRTAGNDMSVMGDAASAGSGSPNGMTFARAQYRIALALALFEYRQEFGYGQSENDTEADAESAEVSS